MHWQHLYRRLVFVSLVTAILKHWHHIIWSIITAASKVRSMMHDGWVHALYFSSLGGLQQHLRLPLNPKAVRHHRYLDLLMVRLQISVSVSFVWREGDGWMKRTWAGIFWIKECNGHYGYFQSPEKVRRTKIPDAKCTGNKCLPLCPDYPN